MKKLICVAAALLAGAILSHATMYVGPWTPIFKGIDHAVGTNFSATTVTNNGVVFTDFTLQVVHCVRVDLTDSGVQLFATPRASSYVAESRETLTLGVPNFIRNFGVQVAVDANFYSANPGGSDPSAEGVSCEAHGLLISTGQVVSVADFQNRYASLMFTSNKVPTINLDNRPPGADTTGIYTAVTGYYPLLTNGVNVWALYYNDFNAAYPDNTIHGVQPRTAYGISQDQRYLYLMTIDGRQGGYSNGALDVETSMWLLQFGAWDAINMDGGGSTAMYMADCVGNPVALNHSSLIGGIGRERYIGAHFGVYAQPLPSFVSAVAAVPGSTTATITWTTSSNTTSQVDYGLTQSYGTLSPLDPTPVTNHTVVLSNLNSGTRYYYRVLSSDGTTQYTSTCGGSSFTTTNIPGLTGLIYGLTNNWKYSTDNLDGINWQAPGYNDTSWTNGPGFLWADSRIPPNPNGVPFENTQLPLNPANSGYPFITYYFRTHFTYTNALAGVTLTFSNYIDDGAAFYLNGVEIQRSFLPNPAFNSTPSGSHFCPSGDANCPYVFTISGDLTTNLLSGDNVLAVEVHNQVFNSPDVTFGQALIYKAPFIIPPPPFITNLVVIPGETAATITWATISNATSQVQYGLTAGLGSSTPLDSTLVTNHSVTLTGLQQVTTFYFFKAVSSVGATQYTASGTFSTVPFNINLVSLTNIWAYQTNNLDGVNWAAPLYDESLFIGLGPALLYIEDNVHVVPRNTPLPGAGSMVFPTYYFRTHFVFNTNLAGLTLVFSNYIDDGAIFYLNGTEVQRVRMPAAPQPVFYADVATGAPNSPDFDAVTNAPDVFRISGDLMTNLVQGSDNVLAAEVHQRTPANVDIVFGSAVSLVRSLVSETKLRVALSGNSANVSWDGTGFTLQQANTLGATNSWSDVPGPVKTSPYTATNPPAFYRLRN